MGSVVSTDYVEAYHYQQPVPIPMEFRDFHFFALDTIRTFIEQHNNGNDLQNTFDLSIFQSHNHVQGPYYGQLDDEKRNGLGIQNYFNKVHVIAYFDQDKIKGEALALFKNNTFYFGLWDEQLQFGNKGLFYDGDIYIGLFQDKQLTFGFIDKEEYEYYGSLKNGMRDGVGRCCFVDGSVYDGEWEKNQFHGNGILYYPNKSHYIGQFNRNIKEGLGIQQAQQSYIGEYMNNKFNGLGKMECIVDKRLQITSGKFENGIPTNLYCCYFEDNPKQKQWCFRENGVVQEVKNAHKNIDIQKLYTFKNSNISDPNIIKVQLLCMFSNKYIKFMKNQMIRLRIKQKQLNYINNRLNLINKGQFNGYLFQDYNDYHILIYINKQNINKMGQIISSEYIELYQNQKVLPTPKHHEYLSVNELKQLKIFTLKEIQTDFNGVETDAFQQHENKYGFYYGHMQNNQRQGLGIQYYNKNNEDMVYLGQFKQDAVQGEGLLLMSDNSLFIGHWNEQKSIDGDNGLYYTKEGDIYCGLWQDRKISFGYQKKLIYEYFGEFQNGLRHGYGKCIYLDGTIYEGQWGNDEMHGHGIQTLYNGVNFVGNFLSSIKVGDGILNTKFDEYLGQFHLDQYHGLGQLMNIHTKRIKEAKWEYGELKGLYCEHTNNEQQKHWYFKNDNGVQSLQLIKNDDSIVKLYEFDEQTHGFAAKRIKLHNMKSEIQNKMKELLPKCIKYQQLSQHQLNRIKSWQSLIQYQQFNEKQ